MVVQRDVKVPIWGIGTDGERVHVKCRGVASLYDSSGGELECSITTYVSRWPIER